MKSASRSTKPAPKRRVNPEALAAAVRPTIAETPATMVPVNQIRPSPENERKKFCGQNFESLCESVKTRGVNDPILIRPIEGQLPRTADVLYEIVYGHRRYQASIRAERPVIPARIVALTDDEARDLRLIENLHREDLSPIELAEGLQRRLDETPGLTLSALAARIQMPESTLSNTLVLTNAPPVLRKALDAGVLSPSHAVPICRVPEPKTRDLLTLNVLTGSPYWNSALTEKDLPADLSEATPLGRAETRQMVSEFCTVALTRRARFPLTMSGLADQVSCENCPKRLGNMAGWKGGQGKNGHVCTDPGCFAEKEAAWNIKTVNDAAAMGRTVLSKDECAKLFFANGPLKSTNAYIDLDADCLGCQPPKPYRKLLPASLVNDSIIATDPTGQPHYLVAREKAAVALKNDHGITIAGHQQPDAKRIADRKEDAARLLKQKVERETDREMLRRAGTAAAGLLPKQLAKGKSDEGEQILRILAHRCVQRLAGDSFDDLMAALEVKGDGKAGKLQAFRDSIRSVGPDTLLVVAVQALACDLTWNGRGVDDEQQHGQYLLNLFRLDRQKVTKEIGDRMQEGEKPKMVNGKLKGESIEMLGMTAKELDAAYIGNANWDKASKGKTPISVNPVRIGKHRYIVSSGAHLGKSQSWNLLPIYETSEFVIRWSAKRLSIAPNFEQRPDSYFGVKVYVERAHLGPHESDEWIIGPTTEQRVLVMQA